MDGLVQLLEILGLVAVTLVAAVAVWRWLWRKIGEVTLEKPSPGCVGVPVTLLVGTGVSATLVLVSIAVR
jgi:hypothetical protein